MEGLSLLGTRRKHVNVLQHIMGYLKKDLSSDDKQELLGLIEDYRTELVPLIVPLTLLKHHLRRNPVPEWVWRQVYLWPYIEDTEVQCEIRRVDSARAGNPRAVS